jgi:hypothetical protein
VTRLISALFVIAFSISAHAVIRPIFIPGKQAIFIMQAFSESGLDLEPRALYDALQVPEQSQSGGTGKGLKTDTEDFLLMCATKGTNPQNVVCTINLKPSSRVQMDALKMIADIQVTGEEALRMYELSAGPGKSDPFVFETKNGWLRIESSRDLFHFHFQR